MIAIKDQGLSIVLYLDIMDSALSGFIRYSVQMFVIYSLIQYSNLSFIATVCVQPCRMLNLLRTVPKNIQKILKNILKWC